MIIVTHLKDHCAKRLLEILAKKLKWANTTRTCSSSARDSTWIRSQRPPEDASHLCDEAQHAAKAQGGRSSPHGPHPCSDCFRGKVHDAQRSRAQLIKSVLEEMRATQAILAVEPVTKDVLYATESIGSMSRPVIYSMDRDNSTNVSHYCYRELLLLPWGLDGRGYSRPGCRVEQGLPCGDFGRHLGYPTLERDPERQDESGERNLDVTCLLATLIDLLLRLTTLLNIWPRPTFVDQTHIPPASLWLLMMPATSSQESLDAVCDSLSVSLIGHTLLRSTSR